jgi:hypothetical protein
MVDYNLPTKFHPNQATESAQNGEDNFFVRRTLDFNLHQTNQLARVASFHKPTHVLSFEQLQLKTAQQLYFKDSFFRCENFPYHYGA